MELTPTESSTGGTVVNHLSYKPRNDLNIYKKSGVESIFLEVANRRKSNIIIGVSIDIPLWRIMTLIKTF